MYVWLIDEGKEGRAACNYAKIGWQSLKVQFMNEMQKLYDYSMQSIVTSSKLHERHLQCMLQKASTTSGSAWTMVQPLAVGSELAVTRGISNR